MMVGYGLHDLQVFSLEIVNTKQSESVSKILWCVTLFGSCQMASHFGAHSFAVLGRAASLPTFLSLIMMSQLLSLLITAAALGEAVGNDANMTSGRMEKGLKVRREGGDGSTVTILHVSDTHSLHRSVRDLPAADLFIHSGDVSTVGSDEEVRDFNDWLGSLKGKYREMLVISGNHDYWETNRRLNRGALSESMAQSPRYFQEKITNAKARSCWDGVFF